MISPLLLDTHALLWLVGGDKRVPTWLREPEIAAVTWISHVSLWEIAIKSSLGRLEVDADLPAQLEQLAVNWLPITADQVWAVRDLPHHHRDPFDRLLICQALDQGLVVATSDPAFGEYGVQVRW